MVCVFAVLCAIAPYSPAHADQPPEGVLVSFTRVNFQWQLDRDPSLTLGVYDRQTKATLGRYDISDCQFCDGVDDNCDQDGILEINPVSRPSQPILGVICHTGAHSQRLQIFAPLQDPKQPIFSLTGGYYITAIPSHDGLIIKYDRENADGLRETVTQNWP